MQRRTFLQAVSAALTAPAIGLAFTPSKPTIRWDLWTDEIATRYDLSSPWVVNDATFATDGRALICSPGCDGDVGDNRKVPSLHQLPWDDFDKNGWRSSREFVAVAAREEMLCPHCFGYGVVGPRTLCDCDDVIWHDITDEALTTCPKCNDRGWLGTACPHCRCGYVQADPYKLKLGDAFFCPGLLAKFQTLGDFDCLLSEQAGHNCLLIRTGEIRGMLMGLR